MDFEYTVYFDQTSDRLYLIWKQTNPKKLIDCMFKCRLIFVISTLPKHNKMKSVIALIVSNLWFVTFTNHFPLTDLSVIFPV